MIIQIVISLVVLWISFRLFRRAAGTLRLGKLNMISWIFYFNLGLQCFLGTVLIMAGKSHFYLLQYVADNAVFFGLG